MFKRLVRGVHKCLPASVRKRLGDDTHTMELLEGSAGAVLARGASFAGTYLLTFAIAWAYGAEELGLFSIAMTVSLLGAMISTLGLETSLVRLVAKHKALGQFEKAKGVCHNAILVATPTSIVVTAAIFFASDWLAVAAFGSPDFAGTLRISAIIILPLVLLGIMTASLRGLKQPVIWSLLHPTGASHTLIAAAFVIASILVPFRYSSILGFGVGALISLVISARLWRIATKGVPTATTSTRELLAISLPMLVTSALSFILLWTDTIMLGFMRTSAEVGIYSAAAKLAASTAFALASVNTIAAPKFSELHATDAKALKNIIRKSNALIFWSSLPVLLLLALFPAQILGLFGAEFASGTGALLILLAGQFINAASGSVGVLLNMTGYHLQFQRIVMIAAGLNILLNFILIPPLGITGAAISTSLSMMVWNIGAVIYIHRKFGILTIYLPGRMTPRHIPPLHRQ